VLFVRFTTSRQELAGAIGQGIGRSYSAAQTAGIPFAGPPFTRYPSMGHGLITIEAGMPLASAGRSDGGVEAGELPAGTAAVALHAGPYDQLSETYAAMERWAVEQGLRFAGAPWESYITDPAEHPDPAQWRTEVYWPLATETPSARAETP
jgi:AraC family transcriptional regulator